MAIVDLSELKRREVELAPLSQRFLAGWQYLIPDESPAEGSAAVTLLDRLVRSVWKTPTASRVWLLFTVVAGAFPTSDDVLLLQRHLRASTAHEAFLVVLECCLPAACRESGASKTIRIISDRPVVDVDFCARRGHNTGIQRVVRETLTRWAAAHHIFEFTVWTKYGTMMRGVTAEESDLVLNWTSDRRTVDLRTQDPVETVTVVPWQTTVVLPEVPDERVSEVLMALARYSGNSVVAVGYDAIPILSADLVPVSDTNRFAKYLAAVKHMDRVLAISDSAAQEFEGFARAVRGQGIPGPEIRSIPLPVDTVAAGSDGRGTKPDLPVVLSVGTREFRKNQTTILVAAELLWREGLRFELLFVGGDAIELSGDFRQILSIVQRKKRAVKILPNASDEILLDAYERARFSVFVSLHEGYGLPVGESLAHQTPVLASNYGSVGDIARAGGCLMVDPRNDDAVRDAMRALLTDDALIESLRKEISARSPRSWDEYAEALWDAALSPVRESA